MTTTEPTGVAATLDAAKSWAAAHCADGAAELLDWRESGVLKDGIVRQVARLCATVVGGDALNLAVRMVETAALRKCVGLDAPTLAPTAATKDPAAIRSEALHAAADWFVKNDFEGERYLAAFKLREMAEGTISPPLAPSIAR